MAQKQAKNTGKQLLSIIAPMYNESENLDTLFTRLKDVLETLPLDYEIICVNDGSADNTLELLVEHHKKDKRIKIVNLSRNFGKERAVKAGFDHAAGDAAICIDSDLQEPPELIPEMVEKWQQGYDSVYAVRKVRHGDTWLKKLTAKWFYQVYNKLVSVPIPRNTGDYRLVNRPIIEALKIMPERNRFNKGLFSWVGFKQTAIEFDRSERHAGTTKFNYIKLWNFALDGITSFSHLPLRVWGGMGVCVSLFSILLAGFYFFRTILYGTDLPGYASIIVTILFLGGIQLVSLGIIGEYLGRLYMEAKDRPLYLTNGTWGFTEKTNEK